MSASGHARLAPVAVGLAVMGGLLVAGATSGHWVTAEELREVGGVQLTQPQGTPGIEIAPQGVAAGMLGALGGLGLLVARRRGRRLVGGLLLATGAATLVVVALGMRVALAEPGQLTVAPALAVLGGVAIAAGGVVALRRPAPPSALGSRYSIDEAPGTEDDEWDVAGEDR